MNSKTQLDEWLKGNPIHRGDNKDGECCPDFSCCGGDLASEAERIDFKNAVETNDEKKKMSMLMMFLSRRIDKANMTGELKQPKKVYITRT